MSGYPDSPYCLYEENRKTNSRNCLLAKAYRCQFDCRFDRLINNAVFNAPVVKPAVLLPIMLPTLILKIRSQRCFTCAACPWVNKPVSDLAVTSAPKLCLDNTFDYGSWRGFLNIILCCISTLQTILQSN